MDFDTPKSEQIVTDSNETFNLSYYDSFSSSGGDKKPIIFWIHGGFGGQYDGRYNGTTTKTNPTIKKLVECNLYRVISYDRRNCGLSDYVNTRYYHVRDIANDAYSLLKALNINHVDVLIGTSMGGVVAQQFALDYPYMFDRLIFLNTSPIMMTTPWGQNADKLYSRIKNSGGEKTSFDLQIPRQFFENNKNNDDTTDSLFERWQGFVKNQVAFLGMDYRPRLVHIKHPTLIVHGDADPVVPYEHGRELFNGLGSSKKIFHTVKGAKHGIWTTDESGIAVLEWIEQQGLSIISGRGGKL